MEQKKPDPTGALPPARPTALERVDSLPPPHFRPSVYEVPVTPGITREAYDSEHDESTPVPRESVEDGFFSQKEVDNALAASPAPVAFDFEGTDFQVKVKEGAEGSADFLRRLSAAVMGGRRESISEIRNSSPDLSLTGGIISATFNIPHSLKYRKGADWVSCREFSCLLPLCTRDPILGRACWGVLPRFGWWG